MVIKPEAPLSLHFLRVEGLHVLLLPVLWATPYKCLDALERFPPCTKRLLPEKQGSSPFHQAFLNAFVLLNHNCFHFCKSLSLLLLEQITIHFLMHFHICSITKAFNQHRMFRQVFQLHDNTISR